MGEIWDFGANPHGARGVFYDQPGAGARRRSVHARLSDVVSVLDFEGVDPTGATSSTTAFDGCFSYCIANKRSMYIPGGTYLLSTDFVADYSGWISHDDEEGPSIIGDGSGVTEIKGIINLQGGTGIGTNTYVKASGLKFRSASSGLRIDNIAFIKIEEVFLSGCTDGLIVTDSLSLTLDNVRGRFCTRGMTFNVVDGSKPNAINLTGCHLGVCSEYGILNTTGTQLVMLGGSIEGCGTNAGGSSSWGIKHTGDVTQGQNGLCLVGVYIENNGGTADVWIDSGSRNCVHKISACNFNRTSSTRYTNYNIRVDQVDASGDGVPYVNVDSCSFEEYNTYVADAARPYIKEFADRAIINQRGNYFSNDLENPKIPEGSTFAECRFDGSAVGPALSFSRSRNVTDVTKNGTGDYTITYMIPRNGSVTVSGNTNTNAFVYLFGDSATTCRVRVISTSGSLVDVSSLRVQVNN